MVTEVDNAVSQSKLKDMSTPSAGKGMQGM